MIADYDLILIVISSRSKIYDKLLINYWIPFLNYIKKNNYRINIFFMFGNNISIIDINIPTENVYVSNSPDSLIPGILIKTIETMDHIHKNYKYKHILRTNLSSFFILENLIQTSNLLPACNVYAGIIGNYQNTIMFVSGAAFWMSKDVVKKIIENKNNINFNLPDDVAVGYFLKEKKMTALSRFDLDKNITYNDNQKAKLLKNIINNNHYHIRIKNRNREIDIDLMIFFTNELYNTH